MFQKYKFSRGTTTDYKPNSLPDYPAVPMSVSYGISNPSYPEDMGFMVPGKYYPREMFPHLIGENLPSQETWGTVTDATVWKDTASYPIAGSLMRVGIVYNSTGASYSNNGGETWYTGTNTLTGTWIGCAHNGSTCFAHTASGTVGRYGTAVDANFYLAVTLPLSASWAPVCWGANIYVLCATTGSSYLTSADGYTWTTRSLPAAQNCARVKFLNGKFYSFGNSSQFLYSTDGLSWTTGAFPAVYNVLDMEYSADKGFFIASCSTAGVCLKSSDGITWEAINLPSSSSWNRVIYGGGIWIIFTTSAYKCAYSADGITWTEGGGYVLATVSAAYYSAATKSYKFGSPANGSVKVTGFNANGLTNSIIKVGTASPTGSTLTRMLRY